MNKNILYSIVTIIVVVAVILSFAYVIPTLEKPKKVLELSTYEKVSSSDLLSNGANHIYFISWYGCPIGADNSWVLYSLLNSTTNGNVSKDVVLHRSIANTPGLLFLKGIPSDFPLNGNPYGNFMENISFSCAGVPFTFTSLYVYNQTLTGTPYNQSMGTPASSGYNASRINVGLSIIRGNLPAPVYNVAKEYETVVPLENHTQSIGDLSGHLVTMIILTGPDGTYVHFWFMYPSLTSSVSPEHVFQTYRTYTPIVNAEAQLLKALGGANVACA